MEVLTIQQFKAKEKESGCLLVDVREEYEFEDENIGGVNIPLAEVLTKLEKIGKSPLVIFLCRSGKRSMAIAQAVERKIQHAGICTIAGGLDAYFEHETASK